MKMKLNKLKLIYVFLALLALSNFVDHGVKAVNLKKTEEGAVLEAEAEAAKHKRHKNKASTETEANIPLNGGIRGNPAPGVLTPDNTTNTTISNSTYLDLNNTFTAQNLNTFVHANRRWDYKLLDKQLQDIFYDMTGKERKEGMETDRRTFIEIYIQEYEACDQNHDNVLNSTEFESCMKNDSYLSQIQIPGQQFAAIKNYTSNDTKTGFYSILFDLYDPYHVGYLNFHDFMLLRLTVYSWKKCSVMAPFIEEVNFECAIEIAAGFKTLSRNTVRRIYMLALELSNSESIRNLDFTTYVIIATSIRIYGKINGKEDNDITRNEFNLALDSNILPMRYNQDVINNIFKLIEEYDRPNQGIDITSFIFYDFTLRIFDVKTPQRKYYLGQNDFSSTFSNFLFFHTTNQEVEMIPQNTLTNGSYQMYTYLNISNYNSENDHFLKSFLELNSKVLKSEEKAAVTSTETTAAANQINITAIANTTKGLEFNANKTYKWLFQALDNDGDSFLNFYDYANFIQIGYLFNKFDVYHKGRIVAGDLYEKYTHYADLPAVSYHLRERAKRFNLLPQDLYVDLYSAILMLRIDDIIDTTTRRSDKTTLLEFELKNILGLINLKFVPDAYLNKCLRGTDANNVPLYDWECAFIQSITRTLTYYENSFAYLTQKNQTLSLANTIFYNSDPALK